MRIISHLFLALLFWGSAFSAATASNTYTETLPESAAATPSTGFHGWWHAWQQDVADTWHAPQHHDLYLPVITWHNRATYDREKTDRYNERPWGGGYGMSRYDENGDWHGIYVMAFKDSFNKWEPIGGYGYEKIWRPVDGQELKFGLGYTAAVTARDNYNYIPIPLVLPLASVGYQRFAFQATYIPGTHNNGNVFFGWLRFQF